MQKVTLFMCMSLNGIIAREDGNEDFLPHYGWIKFVELANKIGNLVIGKQTYEITKKFYEGFGLDDLKHIPKVILTHDKNFHPQGNYIIAHSPQDAVKALKEKGYKEIFLGGGSTVNSSFAKEKLIDEIIFNVEPFIIGKGIPVLKYDDFEDLKLELKSIDQHEKSGVTLTYNVIK